MHLTIHMPNSIRNKPSGDSSPIMQDQKRGSIIEMTKSRSLMAVPVLDLGSIPLHNLLQVEKKESKRGAREYTIHIRV